MKTRNKLVAAAAMLLISAIMLSTASYAWFTISVAPEVKGIQAQTVVNDNLEIALVPTDGKTPASSADSKTGNYYTWGNLVDLSATNLDGATGGNAYTTMLSTATLRPAALSAAGAFTAPTYGSDGRVNVETGLTLTAQANTYGFGTLVNGEDVYGYFMDFWVRTNVGGALILAANNMDRGPEGVKGAGSTVTSDNTFFKSNVNIAVQVIGTQTADATAVTGTAGTIVAATNAEGVLTAPEAGFTTLTANTATLIRVYVYLNGETITNANANTTADADAIKATLNIQFALKNATMNPMDVTPQDPTT